MRLFNKLLKNQVGPYFPRSETWATRRPSISTALTSGVSNRICMPIAVYRVSSLTVCWVLSGIVLTPNYGVNRLVHPVKDSYARAS